jgi:putative ABC transport system permease protein
MRQLSLPVGRSDRTPLPWRNISHNKVALFVSTSAVAFAVIIIFTEVGFLNGLYDSQTQIIDSFHADLIMVSRALHIFNTHETFSRARLQQAAQINGVKAVYPLYIEDTSSLLRNPQADVSSM